MDRRGTPSATSIDIEMAKVDTELNRFPHSIVWTPIPLLTYVW